MSNEVTDKVCPKCLQHYMFAHACWVTGNGHQVIFSDNTNRLQE